MAIMRRKDVLKKKRVESKEDKPPFIEELTINFALIFAILYSLFIFPYILLINRAINIVWLKIYLIFLLVYLGFWIFKKWRSLRYESKN